MKVEAKLNELGFELDEIMPPAGNYVGAVQVGNLLFVSGHGPHIGGKIAVQGRVGSDLTLEQAYDAARVTAVSCLRSVKRAIGDLDKVKRIVKVLGMVMCTEGFVDTPKVINGCSDLLVELYGDNGRHARSAVGMQQLPNNIPVEIEMILEVEA
ncbi:MAG TPA: RidA family protein [Chloroflexota bacterium]|nr:RidA family protein [Chloroflexota bacterium]